MQKLTKGSTTYTWTQGRKLAGVSNGKSIQYLYDHTGNRVKKVVDGVTTEFRMASRLLLSEKRTDDTLQFHYDTNGCGNMLTGSSSQTLAVRLREEYG